MLEKLDIKNMIYEVGGKQVMLDSDLAKLYQCKNGTKSINLAVSRHKDRFPSDFCFQLTKEEFRDLRFQFETASVNDMTRTLPFAFTEQGVAMLATILRTEVASKISIDIMRAFVSIRKYISNNLLEQKYYNDLTVRNTFDIKLLQESFDKLEEKKKNNEIYFNGQIYDAYSKILDIFSECKSELIIIDSYADKTILDIVRRLKVKVILITNNNLLSKEDIERYNKQYSNLKVIYNSSFHDRYFILDRKELYHCGASINRIGYKTFSITLVNDIDIVNILINKIADIF